MAHSVHTSLRQRFLLVGGSILLTFVLLEAVLRLAGAVWLGQQQRRNMAALRQAGTVRVLCVGESTTALGGEQSYPSQLQEVLNDRYPQVRWSVINAGVVGMDTSYILLQMRHLLDTYRPQVVVSMMGINDTGDYLELAPARLFGVRRVFETLRTYKLGVFIFRHARAKFFPGKDRTVVSSPQDDGDNVFRQGLEELKVFLDAVPREPAYLGDYFKAGWQLKAAGDFAAARKAFLTAQEIAFKAQDQETYSMFGDMAVLELARLAHAQQDTDKALQLLRVKSQEGALRHVAYVEMGWIFRSLGRDREAQEAFQKAVELNPSSPEPYIELGWLAWGRGEIDHARKFFLIANQLDPGEVRAVMGVAALLRDSSIESDKTMLPKLFEADPYSDKFIGAARALARERREFRGLVSRLSPRGMYYRRVTVENYRALAGMLERRDIPLVCLQYPMRSLSPLQAIFSGREGITFVDNEASFLEAVSREGFKAYFSDAFAGDFGHCTPKGNRLLAERAAEGIVAAFFRRSPARK